MIPNNLPILYILREVPILSAYLNEVPVLLFFGKLRVPVRVQVEEAAHCVQFPGGPLGVMVALQEDDGIVEQLLGDGLGQYLQDVALFLGEGP